MTTTSVCNVAIWRKICINIAYNTWTLYNYFIILIVVVIAGSETILYLSWLVMFIMTVFVFMTICDCACIYEYM